MSSAIAGAGGQEKRGGGRVKKGSLLWGIVPRCIQFSWCSLSGDGCCLETVYLLVGRSDEDDADDRGRSVSRYYNAYHHEHIEAAAAAPFPHHPACP